MFDFEQLRVYQKALTLNKRIFAFLKINRNIDYFLQDQLKRASVSIPINIAEGVGRLSKLDRRRFFIIARGSTFELIAILQIIFDQYKIGKNDYKDIKIYVEDLVKMLSGLIKNVQPKTHFRET